MPSRIYKIHRTLTLHKLKLNLKHYRLVVLSDKKGISHFVDFYHTICLWSVAEEALRYQVIQVFLKAHRTTCLCLSFIAKIKTSTLFNNRVQNHISRFRSKNCMESWMVKYCSRCTHTHTTGRAYILDQNGTRHFVVPIAIFMPIAMSSLHVWHVPKFNFCLAY